MKRTVLFTLLILLFGASFAVSAQADTWQVIAYDQGGGLLLSIQSGGVVQPIATLPADALPDDADVLIFPSALSPDRRYFALQVDYTAELRVVDFMTGTTTLIAGDGEIVDSAFSPDSTRLAVSLVNTNELYIGYLRVIDLATFTVISEISSEQYLSGLSAMQLDWRADGIYFMPNCWGCEPDIEGSLMRWTPETNEVVETGGDINLFGRLLEATGEWLLPEDHPNFPAAGPYEYFPPNNVVTLLQPDSSEVDVIYFDPEHLELYSPEWVLDGNAFLIPWAESDEAALVYRDGHQQTIGGILSLRFLAGTPDGWLMTGQSPEGDINLYSFGENADGSSILMTTLGSFGGPVWPVEAPLLGASTSGDFPTIPIPEQVTCAGFLSSRLRIHRSGRVVPGDANNLRSDPTANSGIIGQIPGEGFFLVLEGPVCAEGYAWWRVDYNSTIGWTVEGSGDEYWVEPSG